ncbi:hypothetical protein Lal_00020961 [Lupinus albus]|nr:hypothetical protein Lal_00020961 [Lupinus albus]
MDIKNPLVQLPIGRPWIHSAGAIPSSLHQKLWGEDALVSQLSDAPYVEADSEALEASSESTGDCKCFLYRERTPMLNPLPSNASIMMAKFMLRKGFKPGKGLGKYGQGMRTH